MNKIIVDIDGTLAKSDPNAGYSDLKPDQDLVELLKKYKNEGFEIAIYTSRNMRTYSNSIGKINANTLPVIIDWLERHHIPYDEIHVGKPWCGPNGFYIDDRTIRPSEFKKLSQDEIMILLEKG